MKNTEREKLSFENLESGRKQRERKDKNMLGLSGDTLKVYAALTDAFQNIDVITEKSGLAASAVLGALTALEIADLAESTSGKRYKLS